MDERARADDRRFRTARMEAFSDGVFAIAITLLVLEIGVPAGSEGDLLKAVLDEWPSYLGYLASFATIGAIWFGHSIVTEHLEYANSSLIRLNLLVLMAVSFLPFPTALVADSIKNEGAERVAVTIYGVNLLLCTALLSLLWRLAVRDRLVVAERDDDIETVTRRLTPGLAGYVLLIVLGLFVPVAAVIGYFAIAVLLIIPFRRSRRPDQ